MPGETRQTVRAHCSGLVRRFEDVSAFVVDTGGGQEEFEKVKAGENGLFCVADAGCDWVDRGGELVDGINVYLKQ